jgi:hypothetical protein
MTVPLVKPLEARCKACGDTGSMSQDLDGHQDCTACDAVERRAELNSYLSGLSPIMSCRAVAWAAYNFGMRRPVAATAVANAAVSELPPLPDYDWNRKEQEAVRNYARAAIASAQQATPKQALTDEQLADIWINRDCMDAIRAGDIRAQFICAARAAIAASAPNAQLVAALQTCTEIMLSNGLDECEAYENGRAALSAIKGEKA